MQLRQSKYCGFKMNIFASTFQEKHIAITAFNCIARIINTKALLGFKMCIARAYLIFGICLVWLPWLSNVFHMFVSFCGSSLESSLLEL